MHLTERNPALRAARSLFASALGHEFVEDFLEVGATQISGTFVGPFLRHINEGQQIHRHHKSPPGNVRGRAFYVIRHNRASKNDNL